MPSVETSVWVDAPLAHTYAVAQDNAAFPEFMEDLKSLVVVERGPDRVVSDWVGTVPTFGLKVKWRQEDLWDDATHTCRFRQLEGDYDKLEGTWVFTEEQNGTRFVSALEYDYVVPGLGPLVKKVIHGIVVKNMDGVLGSIKLRAESTKP